MDVSDENWYQKSLDVESVLKDIGVDKNIPVLQVFNKIDLVNMRPKMTFNYSRVWVSAKSAAGISYLQEAITTKLYGELIEKEITLSYEKSKLRAQLYSLNAILDEKKLEEGGWLLKIRLTASEISNMQI